MKPVSHLKWVIRYQLMNDKENKYLDKASYFFPHACVSHSNKGSRNALLRLWEKRVKYEEDFDNNVKRFW